MVKVSLFWKDLVVEGDATIIDIEGNEFEVKISTDSEQVLGLHGSVSQMGEFYGITSTRHVWLHYMEANKFEIRVFTYDNTEVVYPIVIGNSDGEESQSFIDPILYTIKLVFENMFKFNIIN